MPVLKVTPEEIKVLRKTLKMSEAEFADRIELEDRQEVKLLESGASRPTAHVAKQILKLFNSAAARSPKLKKLLEEIKLRAQTRWS